MSCTSTGTANVSSGTLEIYQGDDFGQAVLIRTDAGRPVDLTGWTAKAQIRRGVADHNEEVVCEIICEIAEGASEVLLSIPRSETTRICAMEGPFEWDLELLSVDNVNTTIMRGPVLTTQEITRDDIPMFVSDYDGRIQ